MNIRFEDQRTYFKNDTHDWQKYIKKFTHDKQEINNADIKIGFEFEFFTSRDFNIEEIIKNMMVFCNEVAYCPSEFNIQNKDTNIWTIERDGSIDTPTRNGLEIVSPKLNLEDSVYYLKNILRMVRLFGETSNNCGLHFHISSGDNRFKSFDPVKMMLFLDDRKGIELWKDRTTLNKDLMNVFKNTKFNVFKENFNNQTLDRFYTIASKIDKKNPNHIEVRYLGGENYQYKEELLVKEFTCFLNDFYAAIDPLYEYEKYINLAENFIENNENILQNALSLKDLVNLARTNDLFYSGNKMDIEQLMTELVYTKLDENTQLVPVNTLGDEIIDWVDKKYDKEKKEKIISIDI